ncbi:DUF4232 domain-containing protein [Streptomyces sp. 150FB]|uniref:DUF4232 domain-containing protein n=1 Tax=Streptomyces sp. 150FB TaxID=1576605 RepID=UPI000696F6C4|nr:DUF4232 domain-containing protein [Streptomyces sp. 150FB]
MLKYQDSESGLRSGVTRKIAAALAATALVSAAGVGVAQASTASSAKTAAALPTCSVTGLSASLKQPLAGGMMHQGVVLQLKNTSGRTCALLGFPGLGLENAQHKPLTTHTTWGSTWYVASPAKKVVELKSGQTAEAVIAWTHANTGTPDASHAAYLEVTPPASTAHKTLAFDNWVDGGSLDVTALAPHITVTG